MGQNTSNSSPEKSDRNKNIFVHLDHKDSTLQRCLHNFQTKYWLSFGNSGIDKQTIWVTKRTEIEYT